MANIDEIYQNRLKKLEMLKAWGIDPYPAETNQTHTNADFLSRFTDLSADSEQVTLVGRVMSMRHIGAIAFVGIFDGTGQIQVVLNRESEKLRTEVFELFVGAVDIGDFVECTGTAFVTKSDKKSLNLTAWRMLAKSLLPIPSEYFGIKDEDERYRKRYLDILLDERVRKRVQRRSVFWNTIRSFLLARNYVEVHTPILETKIGGSEARPFIAHHNALDIDVFLRISHELWHKKLIAGGIPKVFEIGQVFRNEGTSHEHAQDYVVLELYEAFLDARKGIPMLIDMYRTVSQKTFGTLQFIVNGHEVDLGAKWEHLNYTELMHERYGFDPRDVKLDTIRVLLEKEGIAHGPLSDIGRGVDTLWKQIQKTLSGPVILMGMPAYLEPLAKKSAKDPRVVDRFQIIIGGSKAGKAFNELNDPIDQRARFQQQQALRGADKEDAQAADFEHVETMEYGMPPMFGFAVSERLFALLEGTSIRESQIFPLMRSK